MKHLQSSTYSIATLIPKYKQGIELLIQILPVLSQIRRGYSRILPLRPELYFSTLHSSTAGCWKMTEAAPESCSTSSRVWHSISCTRARRVAVRVSLMSNYHWPEKPLACKGSLVLSRRVSKGQHVSLWSLNQHLKKKSWTPHCCPDISGRYWNMGKKSRRFLVSVWLLCLLVPFLSAFCPIPYEISSCSKQQNLTVWSDGKCSLFCTVTSGVCSSATSHAARCL